MLHTSRSRLKLNIHQVQRVPLMNKDGRVHLYGILSHFWLPPQCLTRMSRLVQHHVVVKKGKLDNETGLQDERSVASYDDFMFNNRVVEVFIINTDSGEQPAIVIK
jgi:hypothetical protein